MRTVCKRHNKQLGTQLVVILLYVESSNTLKVGIQVDVVIVNTIQKGIQLLNQELVPLEFEVIHMQERREPQQQPLDVGFEE